MRQQSDHLVSSKFKLRSKTLLFTGLFVLVLFAMPWIKLPYGQLDWVAFGQPYGPTSTPTQVATATATVTLTSTATTTPTATVTSTSTVAPTASPTLTPTTTPTATATSMPPATSTATATSMPTPTPTGTVTAPPSIPRGTDNLTARAFIDYRCDRYFQEGVDIPLREAFVTLSFPDGSSETRQTTSFGMVYFPGFDASGGVTASVVLPPSYRGRKLGLCSTSLASIELQPDDFRFGYKFVQFGAQVSGELAGP